jgi:hypothetical protein
MIRALASAFAMAWGAAAAAVDGGPAAPAKPAATPAQRAAQAGEHAEHVRRLAAFLDRRLDVATADRDAAMLGCLEEKAARVRALLRTAEDAHAALRRARPPAEADAAAELVKALLARRRADAVRAEAERCLGKLAWQTGAKTRVTVTRPGDPPRAEPSRKGAAPGAAGTGKAP